MADGFKIADAFVEVEAKLDRDQVRREIEGAFNDERINESARQSGDRAGKSFVDGVDNAISAGLDDIIDASDIADMAKPFEDLGDEIDKKASPGLDEENEKIKEKHKGLFSSIVGMAADGAAAAGNAFLNLLGGISPMLANPVAAIAVVTAALVALPLAAAAISVAVVAVFGAMFAAIGILGAAQAEDVQNAWAGMWQRVSGRMEEITRGPMQDALVHVAVTAEATFARLAPALQTMFAEMGPHIESFSDRVGDALVALGPAFGPLTVAFNTLLDEFGAELPGMFAQLADALTDVSNSLSENPEAVRGVLNAIMGLLTGTLHFIAWLTDVYGWMSRLAQGFTSWKDALGLTNNALNMLLPGLGFLGGAAGALAESTDKTVVATNASEVAYAAAASAADALSAAIDRVVGSNITNEQATIKMEGLMDKLTAAVDKNGVSLDINTDKGRASRTIIVDMAAALQSYREKLDEQGKSTQEVNALADTYAKRMVAAAKESGLNAAEVDKLAKSLGLVPRDTKAQIAAPGATDAKRQADDVTNAVNGIPTSKNVSIFVKTEFQDDLSRAALRQAGGALADGGILSFASGGTYGEDHTAQIAPAGAWRVWAEDETGGEAYIPLAESKRGRSTQILGDVASRFGLALAQPVAGGGAPAGGSSSGGRTLHVGGITLNLSAILDLRDASGGARRILTEIREGLRQLEGEYA